MFDMIIAIGVVLFFIGFICVCGLLGYFIGWGNFKKADKNYLDKTLNEFIGGENE